MINRSRVDRFGNFSRRAFVFALGGLAFSRTCQSQDFKVRDGDAEATARGYILDLTAESLGWHFWMTDRDFVQERAKLLNATHEEVEGLKQRWTLKIADDRLSKKLQIEAFEDYAKDESAWKARHPGQEYGDPEHLCWLVFRKSAQIGSVTVNGKEAQFDRETLYVDVPFHYLQKDNSPVVYNFDLKHEMRLQKATAALWVQKSDQKSNLWVYDKCYLRNPKFWS
jgi:hypothetical protein